MTWLIPAKTFLIGEYAALHGGPAILLTTEPYFKITTTTAHNNLANIHPDSPAGKWWSQQKQTELGLIWHDPYFGCGGLGASSAQFVGVFKAWHELHNLEFNIDELFDAYQQYAWQQIGTRPSGYDVLAQSMSGCVVINQHKITPPLYPWIFKDLAFILLHTGQKLATHHHLSTLKLDEHLEELHLIANSAIKAFQTSDNRLLIHSVNDYYTVLLNMGLVAPHTQTIIKKLREDPKILSAKGCGAMGSDTIVILLSVEDLPEIMKKLSQDSLTVLANTKNITINEKIL